MAYMTECCFGFNMYNDNGEIITIPCYADDNKIMLRDSNIGAIDALDTSSTWILIQDNNTTRHVGEDIKRIIINGDAYKVIGVNRLASVKGITKLSLKNDKIDNDRDDLKNGIAYNENSEIPIQKPTSIEISGHDKIYMDLNNTYTINSTKDVIWSVSESWVDIISSNNKECKIFVKENKKLYNKKFILTATTEGKEYTKTIKIIN